MGELDIPSFADFIRDMGEERIAEWVDNAQKSVQREIGFSFDLTNPDDAKRFVMAMFSLNQRATMQMLGDYHAWLCKQLSQRSLRLL